MNAFDTFIDDFSSKGLGKRIKWVIAAGVAVCIVAAFGAWRLIEREFSFSVHATVSSFESKNDATIYSMAVVHEEIEEFTGKKDLIVDAGFVGEEPGTITSIDPVKGVVDVSLPKGGLVLSKAAEVELVLARMPLYRLMMQK